MIRRTWRLGSMMRSVGTAITVSPKDLDSRILFIFTTPSTCTTSFTLLYMVGSSMLIALPSSSSMPSSLPFFFLFIFLSLLSLHLPLSSFSSSSSLFFFFLFLVSPISFPTMSRFNHLWLTSAQDRSVPSHTCQSESSTSPSLSTSLSSGTNHYHHGLAKTSLLLGYQISLFPLSNPYPLLLS